MDLETAAVSREAQTVGAAAVIQEDDPPPPSRLTWLAQHLRISPEEGAPECHLLSRTTTGRGGGGGMPDGTQSKSTVGLMSPLTTVWWLFVFNPNSFLFLILNQYVPKQ